MPIDPNDDPLGLFSNAPQGAEPLDLSTVAPAAPTAPQGGQPPTGVQPQRHGKGRISPDLALAMLMPLAARHGGQAAVSGLLRGMQRAQAGSDQRAQQQFNNQRLLDADQRARDSQAATDKARQGTLQTQQAAARSNLAKNYVADLQTATTGEQIDAIKAIYEQAGAQIGFRPGTLDQLAKQIATPSAMLGRRVRGVVKEMKPGDLEQWMQGGAALQIDGENVPFEVWSHYVPHGVDATGKPIAPPKKPSTANTPQEHAQERYATERGYQSWDDVPYSEQLKVMGEVAAANRAPQPVRQPRQSNADYTTAVKSFRDSMLFAAHQLGGPQGRIDELRSRARRLNLNFDEEVDRASRAAQGEDTKGARARDLARGSGQAIPGVGDYTGRFGAAGQSAGGRGGHAGGPGPVPGAAPAPRTATRADIQNVADKMGVPYAEAERQLKGRGIVVVGQ